MAEGNPSDFQVVTEMPGEPISQLQIDRLMSRYSWAASYCQGKDVVEAACGAGPGLGLLEQASRSLEAGDYAEPILARAKAHYGDRVPLQVFDAQNMPFASDSKDVIILFEALYYLPSAVDFVTECCRVLRAGGVVLVATANKDLWDFHPSAFSTEYYGVVELRELFAEHGLSSEFFGFEPAKQSSPGQKILRLIKRVAVVSGAMPKTMAGKRWLKRVIYGPQITMPHELHRADHEPVVPTLIDGTQPDTVHKIIYCAARLPG